MGIVSGQEDQYAGYVYDEKNNQGVNGARISLQNIDSPWISNEVFSDNNGYYSAYLEPGNYSITVSSNGYETLVQDNVYLSDGYSEDFYLSPQHFDGNDNYDGDGGGDGDGDGEGDGEGEGEGENNIGDFLPSGIGENLGMLAGVCLIVFILVIVSFVIIACSALGIFVRLGKIKKDINEIMVNQENHTSEVYYERPPPERPPRSRRDRSLPPPPPPPPRR
jgi:hypothetical protein